MKINAPIGTNQIRMALLVSLSMIAVIGTVLGFQYIGGYVPCALCYTQRLPYYYAAMPAGFLALVLAMIGGPAVIVRLLLLVTALALIVTAGIAVYHSGVEWGFWQGPESCGVVGDAVNKDAGSLLANLSNTKPPSCNEAAGRFLGLSFAGWNVVVSLIMASIAWHGAFGRGCAEAVGEADAGFGGIKGVADGGRDGGGGPGKHKQGGE
jgi:disulfide bond formation protein DsbB